MYAVTLIAPPNSGLLKSKLVKSLCEAWKGKDYVYLASDDAPNGAIIGAGAGVFTQFRIFETMGLALGTGDNMTPENIAAGWSSVADMDDARELFSGPEQTIKILEQADKA